MHGGVQEALQDHGAADGRPQLRASPRVREAARVCPLQGKNLSKFVFGNIFCFMELSRVEVVLPGAH